MSEREKHDLVIRSETMHSLFSSSPNQQFPDPDPPEPYFLGLATLFESIHFHIQSFIHWSCGRIIKISQDLGRLDLVNHQLGEVCNIATIKEHHMDRVSNLENVLAVKKKQSIMRDNDASTPPGGDIDLF